MFSEELCVWGDSIAKGVVYDEARGRYAVCRENCLLKLGREKGVNISNYSVMGQTSENGLERMRPEQMKEGNIAVIEYGGNDCDLDWKAVSEEPGKRQAGKVPIEQFARNIAEMVRRVREAGMLPVLVTPPPLVAKRYYEWVSKGLNAANILKYLGDVEAIYRWQAGYAEKVKEIAAALGVRLVDIRSRMLEAGRLEDMMCVDGIHPNERGHAVIYEAVAPLLV
ncbi:MAG: SGNH/GDSL hydrolase family protein [Clostridia bacterium]|nr:SGNH/GDSL hydrolase family protein [Clostridia bacterium]